MGTVIGPKANPTRIEDHGRKTLRTGDALGGEIGKVAEDRLGPPIANLDVAVAARKAAEEVVATAWATVTAEDTKSKDAILLLHDTMWNVLGRPRRNAQMDAVFPDGVKTYLSRTPQEQPMLMHVLLSRLGTVSSPRFTDEQCKAWAAPIEALRASYEAALVAHRPTQAVALVADAAYRTAVRGVQAGLRALKRDLQTMGLSDPQIHEIIPDASAGVSSAAVKKPNDGGATPGSGTPAPGTSAGSPGPANSNGNSSGSAAA